MTPNKLADALSDEAMLASKRAQVLRALDYSDEAAILRDTVADELDRQSVRLMRMFAMTLPDDPIAEPAGDVEIESLIADAGGRWGVDSTYIIGASDMFAFLRRLAQPRRQCGCGLDTCKESWEPGCGLGTSIEHAVPVEPQRQGRAVAIVGEKPRVIFYTAGNGPLPAGTKLYTEQPASAAVVDGRKLVPTNATDDMMEAGVDAAIDAPLGADGKPGYRTVRAVYAAMLAAAPDRSEVP